MTLEEFYIQVLRLLKVVPPNGTAQAEDRQRVVDMWPNIHKYLLKRKLINFALADSIPDELVIPLGKIVAYQLVDDFGVSDMHMSKLKSEGELDSIPVSKGERQLRKIADTAYVSNRLQPEYF